MAASSFARARRFLDYYPLAKWATLGTGVATGLLYLALLLLLALFVDLIVHRGEIPAFNNLSSREKAYLWSRLPTPESPDQREPFLRNALKELGVPAENIQRIPTEVLEKVEREIAWWALVPVLLKEGVGEDAADMVRDHFKEHIAQRGLTAAVPVNIEDYGILGLVVRTRGVFLGWLVAPVARWNSWTWANGNMAYLQGLFVLAVLLAFVRSGLMFVSNYMAALATLEAITRLRRGIYHHTYRLGTLAFRALGPGEAVSVSTRHLEAVHDGLYAWLTGVFREPVKFVLLLLFAMAVNFWLGLAFLLFAFLVWLVGGQIAAYVNRQSKEAEQHSAEQLALLQESLMLMRLVKVYLMELFNQARVERQLAKYARAQLQRYQGEALYKPLLIFLCFLAALALLLVAGIVVLHGQLGVTSVTVMVTSLVSLYWPLAAWLENRRVLRRARQSAAILFEFLDRPGTVGQMVEAEFLPGLSKSLEFDEVTLKEPGTGRNLLQGVSFTLNAGQHVALVGPDDMEKHALVYLIPRFLDPNSGEVRIDSKNLRWVTLDSLRAQCAIVLQHNLTFNDTVANNIGCGDPAYTLPRIIEAAKIAHAHHFIQKLPKGYETVVGDMGQSLRISEKFRIALARAILRDPAVLIIEEPAAPLDEDTKSLLDDTYARILPGRTTIFLPHRLSTIRHCDRVFLLYNGRIEASGDHRELLSQNELYRHLQYLEFNEFAGQIAATPASVADLQL